MNKYILSILLLLLFTGLAVADWNITGSDGLDWDGNVTMDNMTEDKGDHYVKIGVYADNFGDGDYDYTVDAGLSVTITDGNANLSSNGNHLYMYGNINFTDFEYVVDQKQMTVGVLPSIIFRRVNSSAFYQVDHYDDYIRLRYYNGAFTTLNTTTFTQTTTWHTFRIVAEGSLLKVFVDNVEKLSATNTSLDCGVIGVGAYFNGKHVLYDNIRLFNTTSGNLTRNIFDSGSGNKTSKVRIQGNNPIAGANITVAINKSIDQSSWVWEQLGVVTTVGDFNVTYNVAGDYRYAKWDFYAQTNNSSQTPVIYNGSLYYETESPSITSYAPTGSIYPEVADSQLFNVTVNQSTQCRWYVNSSLVQTNATPSLTHAYTNTSLNGGGCNVTAVCNNTHGTDTKTWIFEVGADSISYIILQDTPTNQSMIMEINVTRIGSNVTDWGWWQNHTFDGWQYFFRFTNGTAIKSLTASGNNDTLWFNHTSLLPTGVYFINSTTTYNAITLYANEYALINNHTTDQTYQQVDNNITNAVCFSYYNSTSGLWEAYRAGYTYNANTVIPKNCSVFVFVDGQTTISATVNTDGVTIQNASWFYGYLPGSTAKTLTEIETAMNADGLDVWALYGFSNSTQAYADTGSYSVEAGEGYAVYVNTTGEYTP